MQFWKGPKWFILGLVCGEDSYFFLEPGLCVCNLRNLQTSAEMGHFAHFGVIIYA